MIILISHIIGLLARWRAHRKQNRAEQEEAQRRERFESHKRELLYVAGKALMQHSNEYPVEGLWLEDELIIDDTHVTLTSAFNPDAGEKETIVKVTSPKVGLVLVTAFSPRAEWGSPQWRTVISDVDVSPGSIQSPRAGALLTML